jgi:hypothetical protein
VFAVLSVIFSLGNIENSKGLQVVSVCMRFLSITLMIGTSIVAIFMYGPTPASELNWFNFAEISDLFGNTIFIFILHHSVSGIVYPVRPQEKVKPMFLSSFSLGAGVLIIEGFLAALAFGKEEYKTREVGAFPCEIQELYNENFLKVPVVAQITNFYPFFNVSAVPVLVITLRNNIFQLLGLEQSASTPKWQKLLWSIGLQTPVIIAAFFLDNPQVLITYTGGTTGVFIMLVIPATFFLGSKKYDMETVFNQKNFNKSFLSHKFWGYFTYAFGAFSLGMIVYGLATGSGGGH